MDLDETSSQGEEEETWDDFQEEAAQDSVQSLFSDARLPTIAAALQHDTRAFGFNFASFREQVGLDDFQTIMCINFIRSQVAAGVDVLPSLAHAVASGQRPWQDEQFMKPVLADDEMLLHDWDEDAVMSENVVMSERLDGDPGPSTVASSDAAKQLEALERENAVLRSTVQCLAAYLPDDVAPEVVGRLSDDGRWLANTMSELDINRPTASGSNAAPLRVQKQGFARRRAIEAADEKYFNSYGRFGIHREMLSDKARTEAYRQALEQNPKLMKGATVLDVGCGTGILSMFAARGGASRVIGVDGSQVMAGFAKQVVAQNRLDSDSGGPVSIVAGRIEELNRLPVEKVDVIVSEWMGYTLLFETMLGTVLTARNRWLKPGGAMLPDVATLYIAAAGPAALDTGFWSDVYGFSMEPIAAAAREYSLSDALVVQVAAGAVLTEPAVVRRFDLPTMHNSETDFSTDFELAAKAEGSGGPMECHAMVIWFDVEFSRRFCSQQPVTLSTSPFAAPTHWAQTVLPLRVPISLISSDGRPGSIKGRISIAHSQMHRSLDISLEYVIPAGKGSGSTQTIASVYSIEVS